MLPIQVLQVIHSPIRGHRGYLRLGGRVPADRFSPSRESRFPVSSFQRAIPHPRLAVSLLRRLLTSQGISALGSPQIRACCFPARPPHLPPWLNQRASLCCASSPRHVGLLCGFCSSAHQFPASLPPRARLPSRSWLHVVVLSRFHMLVLLQGSCTPFTTRPCWAYTTTSSLQNDPRLARPILKLRSSLGREK